MDILLLGLTLEFHVLYKVKLLAGYKNDFPLYPKGNFLLDERTDNKQVPC